MQAIIETGGKQYRVASGQQLRVERLEAEPGDQVEFDRVLLLEDDGTVEIGDPTIAGARVLAHVLSQPRGEKLVVFKFKAKVRYRRKTGHRQALTELRIGDIVKGSTAPPARRGRQGGQPRARAAGPTAEVGGADRLAEDSQPAQ